MELVKPQRYNVANRMLHWPHNRQIEGRYSIGKYKKRGFQQVFEGLKKLTCYPPDHFAFLQADNEDELVPSFSAAFSNINPDILASADEDGIMRFFDTRKALSNGFVSGFEAHDNAIFDIAWAHKEPWIVTASGDQSAVLWDAPSGKKKAIFKQHSGSLKSVSFGFQNNNILATGARDGSIIIWDTRCSESRKNRPVPIATITKAHEDKDLSRVKPRWRRGMSKAMLNINPLQSVTSVLFQSDNLLLSSGSADGIVKMWDVRALPKKQKKTPDPYYGYHYGGNSQGKHGFSSLTIDSSRSRFYANCTDGVVYAYDCVGVLSGQPAAKYSGHVNSTFYVKSLLSPDDQYLLSGSSDSNAYIWKTDEPDKPPIILSGHSGEVTAVAWSPIDKTKVVTCADDCTMRIWRMKQEGVKEEERPIGEAKWEQPSSGEGNRYNFAVKRDWKREIQSKGWATPPTNNKSNRNENGKEQSDEPKDRKEVLQNSERISKDKSPLKDSVECDVTKTTSSPTTPRMSVAKETYCKRRGKRLSSLKDWINRTDSENSRLMNTGSNADTRSGESRSESVLDVHQRVTHLTQAEHKAESKNDKENKLPNKEQKENHIFRLVRPDKEDKIKGSTQSIVGGRDNPQDGKELSIERTSTCKQEINVRDIQDKVEKKRGGEGVDLRNKGNRAGSSSEEVQEEHSNTPKVRVSKRRKGDQIFDYFQPLKRQRTDSHHNLQRHNMWSSDDSPVNFQLNHYQFNLIH
ncbi:putative denticleless protein-like isoform X1 [Apostichopus japonicus]|uniref:Putative denticleless protein-like isoform X1 n=1 Tax=Stichopus japonicus TaxID=307972 RepID=A0A2G8L4K1_STIJA|nr:putative denticleless protein-like isoform X1 [Apostichopus japonicus]